MISQETQYQKQIHQIKVWLSAGVFVKLILTKSWQKISMVQISAAWKQWYLSQQTRGKPIISHWAQITVKWTPQVTVMHCREIISLSLVQINSPCNITIRQTQENYSPLNIDFTLSYCLQCLNNWCNALSPSENTVWNEMKLLNMIKHHPPPTLCETLWGSLSMSGTPRNFLGTYEFQVCLFWRVLFHRKASWVEVERCSHVTSGGGSGTGKPTVKTNK